MSVRRRSRPALWGAIALGVVLALLVGVLATRSPASDRLVRSPLVGKGAPAIQGRTVDGSGTFSLDDHRGQFVLVNFFATWCTPCQAEHGDIKRFADAHAAAGDAAVVSVVFSDQTADVQRFFQQHGGSWPVVRDDDGVIATDWGVARVPESYLVGPSGVVIGKVTGGVTYAFLQRELAQLQAGR
jgi:cytochrome c biogenesis protein CcmG/thiol:disulfide interchange protein DsbE